MTDPINSQNRLRNTGVSSDTRAGGAAKSTTQGTDSQAAAGGGAAARTDVVELSNATLLEALNEQIKNLPEVNSTRVDAVKEALSNGEYQADAEVIARKYSEIEKLLP